jgi:hypothetical protein
MSPNGETGLPERSALEVQKLAAEIQKIQTERRKAELEISELTRWYRRPAFLQPVAAIVIGTLTAMIGTANGWFSTKLDRLKLEQETIQRQIGDLTAGRTSLSKQIASLTIQRNQLQERFSAVVSSADRLSKELLEARRVSSSTSQKYKQLEKLQGDLALALMHARTATAPPIVLTGHVIEKGTETTIPGAKVVALDEVTATDFDGIFRIYYHPNWEGLNLIHLVIDSPGHERSETDVKPSDKVETFGLVRR